MSVWGDDVGRARARVGAVWKARLVPYANSTMLAVVPTVDRWDWWTGCVEKDTRAVTDLLRGIRAARRAHPTLREARRIPAKPGLPHQNSCQFNWLVNLHAWAEIGLAASPRYFSGRAGEPMGAIYPVEDAGHSGRAGVGECS